MVGRWTPRAAPWSFGNQDIGSPGNKSFVEPHPTDAEKIIRTSRSRARGGNLIPSGPDFRTASRRSGFRDFRMVSDPKDSPCDHADGRDGFGRRAAGRSERIVVQSSRNVEFSYLVQECDARSRSGPGTQEQHLCPERANSRIDETLAPDLSGASSRTAPTTRMERPTSTRRGNWAGTGSGRKRTRRKPLRSE